MVVVFAEICGTSSVLLSIYLLHANSGGGVSNGRTCRKNIAQVNFPSFFFPIVYIYIGSLEVNESNTQ